MFKRYLQHVHSRTPHERRQHAIQIACVVMALIALIWITTLGIRLNSQSGTNQISETTDNQTQLANVTSGVSNAPTLQVSTTGIPGSTQ